MKVYYPNNSKVYLKYYVIYFKINYIFYLYIINNIKTI